MSTRRVKALEYDEDDVYEDEYEDEQDELTEDDKIQLQEGTAKVKSLLSDSIAVTDKEIQDALWHYYYDIDKSVTYLKNSKKPKPTPKAKSQPVTNGESCHSYLLHCTCSFLCRFMQFADF
jgi:elongation factor 1 alpha-like protein